MNIKSIFLAAAFLLFAFQANCQSNSFSENFERTSNSQPLPSGWDGTSDYVAGASGKSNSYLWKSTALTAANNHEPVAGRCAALSAKHSNTIKSRLKSPVITLSSTKYAKLKFKLRNATTAGAAGDFSVYISTDGGSTYLQNPLVQHISTGNVWTDYEFSLDPYIGQNIVLVFEGASSGTSTVYYYFLDNIEISDAPSCQTPTQLTVSSLADVSATFSWYLDQQYGSVPSQYFIQLIDESETLIVDSTGYVTYSNSFNFTDLTPNTTYTARVKSDCSDSHKGTSDWQELTFTTTPSPSPLPMFVDFNTLYSFPDGTISQNATLFSASASTQNFVYGGSGKSLRLCTTTSDISYFVLPFVNAAANDLEIEFKIKRGEAYSETAGTIVYQVGYVTDVSNINDNFIPVILDSLVEDTEWQSILFNTANIGDATTPVAFCLYVGAGYTTCVYVDNIDIHQLPSCRRPEGLTAYNPTSSSVSLAWDYASSSVIAFRAEANDGTVVLDTAYQNPFIMSGLAANTLYNITANTVCGNDTSLWTNPITIKTQCQINPTTTLAEGFESIPAYSAPDCWRMGWLNKPSGTIAAAPFTATTQRSYSGLYGMSFVEQENGAVAYLSSPLISFPQAGDYDITLWMYRKNNPNHANERIEIWATPLENSTAGGILLGTIYSHFSYGEAEENDGWFIYQYNINVQGNYHITFVCYGEGDSMEFDDVAIIPAPACRDIKHLKQGRVGINDINLEWVSVGNETQWIVDYQLYMRNASDSVLVRDTVVTSNNTSLSIGNLLPATIYDVTATVRAICPSGDTAEGVSLTLQNVQTRCEPLSSLPYMTSFETIDQNSTGVNTLPMCWTRLSDGQRDNFYPYNYLSSSYARNGTQCLYFYVHQLSSTGVFPTYNAVVLPAVDTTICYANQLKLRLSARNIAGVEASQEYPKLMIGVMSDPDDINTFVPVDTISISNVYSDYTVLFTSYTGDGIYPAFKAESTLKEYKFVVDDVSLEFNNNCDDISGGVHIDDVMSSSVTVSIFDPTVSVWEAACCVAGQMPDNGIKTTVIGTVNTTIYGLSPQTDYTVYVRRVCGEEYGSWSVGESFRTKCPAISSYPFFDDFESHEVGFLGGCYDVTSSSSGELKVMQQSESATYGEIYNHTPGGAKGIMCSDPSSPGLYYPMSGSFTISRIAHLRPGKQYAVSVWAKQFEYYSNYEWMLTFRYGLKSTNQTTIETFNIVDKTFKLYKTTFTVDIEGDYYITIVTNPGDNNPQYYPQFDDLTIDEFSCADAGDLVVQDIDSTSFVISYTNLGQLWQYAVSTDSTCIDGGLVNPIFMDTCTQNTLTINGLIPNTDYYCVARNICNTIDTSKWSELDVVHTKCNVITVPHSDSFEQDKDFNCWAMLASGSNAAKFTRSRTNSKAGFSSLNFQNCIAVSPEYDVDSLHHYYMYGWVLSENDNAYMNVAVMTDPDDISTSSDPIATISIPEKNKWYEFVVYFDDLSDPDYEDFKYSRFINFTGGSNSIYLDSITIEPVGACLMPYGAQISNITSTSFDINFIEHGSATEWIVYTNGIANIINTNPATIADLMPATNYEVTLASSCSTTSESKPFACGTIRTECGVAPLPWSTSFEQNEDYTSVSYREGELEEKCWMTYNVKPNNESYPYYYMSTKYAVTGQQSLLLYNNAASSTNDMYVILPELAGASNNLHLKFHYLNSSETSPALEVGYLTNPTNKNSFVLVRSLPNVDTWTVVDVFTNTISSIPSTARLALRANRTNSAGYIYIDDISVSQPRNCSEPETPVIESVTEHSVTVSITDTCSSHNHWQYCVGEKGIDMNTLDISDVYTDSFEIENIASATTYYLYVRAICGPGDESNWVKTSFTTECEPVYLTAGVPFVDSFEDQPTNIPITGCYSSEGTYDNTNCVRGYTNPVSTTINYDYILTGQKCLYAASNSEYQPNGQTIYRKFYFEKGKTYNAGVYTRAYSNPSAMSLLVGRDTTSMSILAESIIDQHAAIDYSFRPFWQWMGNYFTVDSSAVYFIAIHADYCGNNYYSYLYFDDLTVEEIAGCAPSLASLVSTSTSTVTIAMSDTSSQSSFQYRIMKGDSIAVSETAVPSYIFTVNGLHHSTEYVAQVRRDCGNGDYSNWFSVDFSTQCYVHDEFPITESFEGTIFPPHCWTVTGTDSVTWDRYSSMSTMYIGDGNACAHVPSFAKNQYALLSTPEINFQGNREYKVRFKLYRGTSSNTNKVEVYLSPSATSLDYAHYLGEATVSGAPKSGTYDCPFEIPEGTNGNYYIIFRCGSTSKAASTTIYLDDVVIERLPSCNVPGNITIIGSTSSSVTVFSQPNAEHSAVRYYCVNGDDVQVSPDCNGTYTFTGLSANTEYQFAACGICGPEDISVATAYVKASTTTTDCFAPQNLRTIGIISHNNAKVTWFNAPQSTSTFYKLSASGTVVKSGITTGDTLVLDSLNTSTSYTISISNYCSGDTTEWTSLNFTTSAYAFEIPFICGFEDASQNSHWNMRNLSSGPNWFIIGQSPNAVYSGSKALYVTNDGSSYNYTSLTSTGTGSDAEALIQMPAGYYSVEYDWKCLGVIDNNYIRDYGRLFIVPASKTIGEISTAHYNTTTISGAIVTDEGPLNNSSVWQHQKATIEIPEDGIYRIVVMFANDAKWSGQPPLAIDNISIDKIECMPVKNTTIIGITTNSASLAVRKHEASSPVQYGYSTYSTADSVQQWTTSVTRFKNDTITFTGLQSNETYYLFTRHLCDSLSWSEAICDTIRTPATVVNTPYVCSFEADESDLGSWMITNSSTSNSFVIGNATASSGNNSLFVTNDGSSYSYNLTESSASYAYIPLNFNAGNYEITYDWHGEGEDDKDYARLFLAPLTMIFNDGDIPVGLSDRTLPIGCTPLDGGSRLNLSSSWKKSCYSSFNISNDNVYYLVAYWHNDGSNGVQPPFAIDNIKVNAITCPRPEPELVTQSESQTHSATLNIAGGAVTTLSYEIFSDRMLTNTVTTGQISQGDSIITIEGLASSSWYYATLRYLCSDSDSSALSVISFRTACETLSQYPYIEDFEEVEEINNSNTYDVLHDVCWDVEVSAISAYYAISTNTTQVYRGLQSLVINNGGISGISQTYAMPYVDDLNGKRLTLNYKHSTNNVRALTFSIGYLAQPEDASSFVSIYTAPISAEYTTAEAIYSGVPSNARPAFRAAGYFSISIDDVRINNIISAAAIADTVCSGAGYYRYGFSCPASTLQSGDTTLTRLKESNVLGESDTIITINLHVLDEIVVTTQDTICAGEDYVKGYWNLVKPTSGMYFDTYTSSTGCDSTVNLILTVIPTTETLRDTICMGETYSFCGQNLTATGTYVGYTVNSFGCNDTITLTLFVIDTLMTTNATICSGDTYQFEGNTYTQTGTYTVVKPGTHGCSVTRVLNLTVIPTDSTINVAICQGGNALVVDTLISTAGNYTLVRMGTGGCPLIYHINATINPIIHEDVNDYVCEGYTYSGNGISNLTVTNDTAVTVNMRTADQLCDSSVTVYISILPTQYSDTTAYIKEGEYLTWYDETYTTAGNYTAQLRDENGCDSIVTLHLIVEAGVENVEHNLMVKIVPNPVATDQTTFVYVDEDVVNVEILNQFGQIVSTFAPSTYPIEVDGINVEGIYYVRLTLTDGKVAVQKLMVK